MKNLLLHLTEYLNNFIKWLGKQNMMPVIYNYFVFFKKNLPYIQNKITQ